MGVRLNTGHQTERCHDIIGQIPLRDRVPNQYNTTRVSLSAISDEILLRDTGIQEAQKTVPLKSEIPKAHFLAGIIDYQQTGIRVYWKPNGAQVNTAIFFREEYLIGRQAQVLSGQIEGKGKTKLLLQVVLDGYLPDHIVCIGAVIIDETDLIIVDECHHVGASSFDAILKRVRARFVLGLTATPIRRDGLHPIIFMQCGPIRQTAAKPANAPHDLTVTPQLHTARIELPTETGIQDVFRHIANDQSRTQAIVSEIVSAFGQG
ncbi:MAG: DEAD/DEAH box helicase family protein, partial [Armatimonadetes bacterium]|nr:DEAD/DEAH box helicase family protein [Armatimonadota bacterium]